MPGDESLQEKTEDPTPKREREAREKGQVPSSQEVYTAVLLLAGAALVGPGAGGIASGMARLFEEMLASPTTVPVGPVRTAEWFRSMGWRVMGFVGPPLGMVAGTVAVVGALQGRGVISFHPLKPQLQRVSPLANAKKIFGVRSLANLAKSLLKMVIVLAAVWVVFSGSLSDFFALAQESPFALLSVIHEYAARVLFVSGLAFLALASADYGFEVWQHQEQMKMTREEVKREKKETEGEPMVEARRDALRRSMTRNKMIQAVPDADVVVTNPTHIAVALKYDPLEAPAPVVVAMGQRKIAQRIREVAHEAGVPVIENKPLARALLGSARVGTAIPVELYVAVAELLAFVFRQRAEARAGYGAGAGGRGEP